MIQRHASKGFTLVEILVATAVFSVVMLVASNVFLIATKSQRRAASVQRLQGDIRFSQEAIGREIRFGFIDYDFYETFDCDTVDGSNPLGLTWCNGKVDLLALRDGESNRIRYRVLPVGASGELKLQVCFINILTESLTKCDSTANWQIVTPEGVQIIRANFYIAPTSDPFRLCDPGETDIYSSLYCSVPESPPTPGSPFTADTQPRVTMVFRTQQLGVEPSPENVATQTTVVSRSYLR